MQGAIVPIQELARLGRVCKTSRVQERCKREVEVLWNEQVREELQEFRACLTFAVSGWVQGRDRL